MKKEEKEEDFFPDEYNLEEVFDSKIKPLLTTIINICDEYEIPMVASFQYRTNKEEVALCTSAILPPKRTSLTLHDVVKLLADIE